MGQLKSAFDFGSEETEKFWYVGIDMHQNLEGLLIVQNHYVKNLELLNINVVKDCKIQKTLCHLMDRKNFVQHWENNWRSEVKVGLIYVLMQSV